MCGIDIFHNFKSNARQSSLLLSVFFVTVLMGCSTPPPQRPNYFATDYGSYTTKFNKVALVADKTPPEIEVDLGKTQGKSTTEGAAAGALQGATYSLIAGPAYFLVLPYFVAAGVIGGAASGAASGYSTETLAEAEAKSKEILDSAYMQNELLARIQEYGNSHVDMEFIRTPSVDPEVLLDKPDYTLLVKQSFDAVIEVEILRIALKAYDSKNKLIRLIMQTRIRLVSTHTGKILSDNQYEYTSSGYQLEEWLTDAGALLTSEFERGLQLHAEDTIDENFLLYYPMKPPKLPLKQDIGEKEQLQRECVPPYVLYPMYPKLDCLSYYGCSFVETDSLQPTLRWEQFPREVDLINTDATRNQFTDVQYELRIFQLEQKRGTSAKIKQIYYTRDIPQAHHKVEIELNACTSYVWTVRARFKLNGKTRVTEWAMYNIRCSFKPWPSRRSGRGNELRSYYRFKTPCDSEKTEGYENSAQDNAF